jgi:glucose-1-phosphate thymidylyltransferase
MLMVAGLRNFCLISDPESLPAIKSPLGSGEQFGFSIDYREQKKPEGIARTFLIDSDFVGSDNVTLLLGDNIFSGGDDFPRAISAFQGGATIFAYEVKDPQHYVVLQFTPQGRVLSLEEKPSKPKSKFPAPCAHIYDHQVVEITQSIKPPARGELEITNFNLECLRRNQLSVHRLSRGLAWLDVGPFGALQEASAYIEVEAIERRQGGKTRCREEAALVRGFTNLTQLHALVQAMPNCEYRDYLNFVADEASQRLLV